MEHNKIRAVIEEITVITDLLYQENFDEAYPLLANLFRNLIALTADISEEDQKEFVEVLQPALEAMENQDMTLLADILQYELVEKLEGYLS